MKYTEIGKTGIQISQICLGGMSFGQASEDFLLWTLDCEKTFAVIAHALEAGVNFIDTANCYSHGTSEEYIGKALRRLNVPRDRVVLASKVYYNTGKLSKDAILREAEASLRRLGTDYLDIYYIHRFDYDTPIEETLTALDFLVKAGKVRALGASAMYGYQFHNLQVVAERNGLTPFSAMQNHYNLLYREDEREMIPICRQYGVSLIPYRPLAGGHLTRTEWKTDSLRCRTENPNRKKYDRAMSNDLRVIARVAEVARCHNASMSQVALAWLLEKGVAAPVVGVTHIDHFDDAVGAVDLALTDEEILALEELYERHKIIGALPEE